MNTAEAIRLLAHCAAFDNRQPSRAAAEAWAAALHDVPLDEDTLAAVARYYGTPDSDSGQKWIQPHHVRTHRNALRDDRLGPPGPGLSPQIPAADPDDVQGYLRALREQRARAAAGQEVPALSAGDADAQEHPDAKAIREKFEQAKAEARRRKAEQARAESEALAAYRQAVETLLALPDHGATALAAARDYLLGDEQAARGFPELQATPGVMDEHKIHIWAARAVTDGREEDL